MRRNIITECLMVSVCEHLRDWQLLEIILCREVPHFGTIVLAKHKPDSLKMASPYFYLWEPQRTTAKHHSHIVTHMNDNEMPKCLISELA